MWHEHSAKTISDFLNKHGIFFQNMILKKKQTFSLTNVCTMHYNRVISSIFSFSKPCQLIHVDLKVCFKTITDTSIQWLQYRIIYRIITYNKINVISYDVCAFCKENVETV